MQGHIKLIKQWISDNENIDCNAAFDPPELEPKAISFVTPPPKAKRKLNLYQQTVRSQRQTVTVRGIPKTHSLVLTADLNRWKNDSAVVNNIRQKLQSNQYTTNSVLSQSLWGIAMATVPALAFSAAQYLFPLIVYAFLHDTGIFDKLNINLYAKSFPSDWSLRQMSFKQATRDTMSLGIRLTDKKIYVAADKGNKKGVGHFAKILCWWEDGRVHTELLDIDASGGSSKDCAKSLESSMNKLKLTDNANTHLFHGQSTDSGGGGTLESLHKHMKELGLCVADEDYLTAGCTLHSLQLQLGNAIKETFGQGALDKVNAMQLLHSVYRLQESIDLAEWRHILYLSSQFVAGHDATANTEVNERMPAAEKNRRMFLQSYNKIVKFHGAFHKQPEDNPATLKKYLETIYGKMTAPILTRWWTVGAAAAYVFKYYLHIFHAAQTVINMYPSNSNPYNIASDLFSLMSNQENFVDMTLIRCFHKAYVNKHFGWLQACDDLSGTVGFQSHNIAARYYCMSRDIEHIMSGRSMEDYQEATDKLPDEDGNRQRNFNKLSVFVGHAAESLHKHFGRWLTPSLLPAALLSEGPLAKVVAAAILGNDLSPQEFPVDRTTGRINFYSTAHDFTFCLRQFNRFLKQRLDKINNHGDFTTEAKEAAAKVSAGVELRTFQYDGDAGELRLHMHSSYLALPCHTQFVETAIKEAKIVSATDRSEELRTCIAIIRSATPLGFKGQKQANKRKIMSILDSAKSRSNQHVELDRDQVDNEYDARFNQVVYALSRGHYKHERIDAKLTRVDNEGAKYRKQNKAQLAKQQTLMPAVTGLIPYNKVTQKRNKEDMRMEIRHRMWQLNYQTPLPVTVKDQKPLLMKLEAIRLTEEGMAFGDAIGNKSFLIQSEATFKLSD